MNAPVLLHGGRPLVRFPPVFRDWDRPARYKATYGGRGSAKSWTLAQKALLKASTTHGFRVGCFREIQISIASSVKQLLDDVINTWKLTTADGEPFFQSIENEIRGANGSLFTFAGLRTNPDKVKSTEGLDLAWIEEANRVSENSLTILRPTLRSSGSEIWFSWNPGSPDDPVDRMFRTPDGLPRTPETGAPPRSIIVPVNWRDNPWFDRDPRNPHVDPSELREEMEYDFNRDYDKYLHVWEGHYRRHSNATVFRNWRCEAFDDPPPGTHLYYGADWGFATDPSVLVRCWLQGRTLYVDYEAWGLGVEIDYLPALFAGDDPLQTQYRRPRWENPKRWPGVPGALDWPIRADSARPDTISYVARRGFKIVSARKGAGSLEEGVTFLQSVDIVVHPRCRHVRSELEGYSYKVDERTETVLPILEDRKNHTIDSLRYALEDARQPRGGAVITTGRTH